jgi:peroxiredoxin
MISPGQPAPALELRTPEGRPVSLQAACTIGPVIAAFFKSSCPTCQLAFPYLEKFHKAFAESGLTVLGISQESAEETVRFALEKGDSFRMLLDPEPYEASRTWGVENVPTFYLVGRDGMVWEALTGWSRQEMNSLALTIAKMVSAEPVVISAEDDGAPAWRPG